MDTTMQGQGVSPELTPRLNSNKDFQLRIVQEPTEAKIQIPSNKSPTATNNAATPSKKERGMIDPPPILELVSSETDPEKWMYIHNPNWFCSASLVVVDIDPSRSNLPDTNRANMTGQLVSSLHKVKSPADRREHGYFAFGELSVRSVGTYKLKFTLFEIRRDPVSNQTYAIEIHSIMSQVFRVTGVRQSGPNRPATDLSKTLVEAGVKLRVRKEPTRRRPTQQDWHTGSQQTASRSQNTQIAPVPPYQTSDRMPAGSRYSRNTGIDLGDRLTTRDEPLVSPVEPSSQIDRFARQGPQSQEMNGRGGQTTWESTAGTYTSSPTPLNQNPAYHTGQLEYPYGGPSTQEASWEHGHHSNMVMRPAGTSLASQSGHDTGRGQPSPKRSRDSGYGRSVPNTNFLPPTSIAQSQGGQDYMIYNQNPPLPTAEMSSQMNYTQQMYAPPTNTNYVPFARPNEMTPGNYPQVLQNGMPHNSFSSIPQSEVHHNPFQTGPQTALPPATFPGNPEFSFQSQNQSFQPQNQYFGGGPHYPNSQ